MELPQIQGQIGQSLQRLTGQPLTDAWMAGQPSYNSTVLGNIGTVLDKGFRFGSTGGYQKIKMTGLTDGQVYTFTTYSQSWAGSRTMKVSCSDLPGATFSFNQDKYQDSAYDGLLGRVHLCSRWYGSRIYRCRM